MSKILSKNQQQNALQNARQNQNGAENHKKTTPAAQNRNINDNNTNKSRGSSGSGVVNANSAHQTGAKSTVTGVTKSHSHSPSSHSSSESPNTSSSSPITVDYDDFTSSSIMEFLAREQECSIDEVDAESIFQEVGRLADNTDTRSVEDILREAELLMQQQKLLGCGDGRSEKTGHGNKKRSPRKVADRAEIEQQTQKMQSLSMDSVKIKRKYTQCIENMTPAQILKQTQMETGSRRLPNGNCNSYHELIQHSHATAPKTPMTPMTPTHPITPQTPTPTPTPTAAIKHFEVFVENLPSVSVISEESTPKDMQCITAATEADVTTLALLNGDDDDDETDTIEEITEGIESIELPLNADSPPEGVNSTIHTKQSKSADDHSFESNCTNEANSDDDVYVDAEADEAMSDDDASSAKGVAKRENLNNSHNLSMSSSSFSHFSASHTQNTSQSEKASSSNVMECRRSCDASQMPQQQQSIYAQQARVAGSPAHRSVYSNFGVVSAQQQQLNSPSRLERRSSFGFAASGGVTQRSSMTTPDSGFSQMQSSQISSPAGPYSPHRTISTPLAAKSTYCDKAVNSSPKRLISTLTSPIEPFATANVGREHVLKQEIEQLQEKLKDTEERLQSLRIQHDSLSQLHRDLRESNTKLQEESEVLKLDVQHLNECANILRSELQTARLDRNEALELQKTLQSELEESRQERKRVQELKDKDAKTIQDLQRQCREMERILMRKHPDSVSALIVASKSPGKCANSDQETSRKLLEQRIAQLESDAKEQDLKAQQILANVQARFNSVQAKYETHIGDLETQVLSLQEINTKLNEKIESQVRTLDYFVSKKAENFYNNCTQTDANMSEAEGVASACSNDITKCASSAVATAVEGAIKSSATQTITETKNTRDHSTNTIGTSSAVHSASSSTSSTANSTPNTSRPNSKQSGIRKPLATAAMGSLSTAVASKLPVSHSDMSLSAHHSAHTAHVAAREDAHLLATIRGMRVDLAIKDKAMQRLTRELEECKKTIKKLQREKDALKSDKSRWNSYTCLNITRRNHESNNEQMPATTESQALREAQNKLKLLQTDYKMLHDKRLNDLKILQSAHERELASCHETVRVLQQRLNEREEAFASQKRRKLPVDYYALKAKVSSLERRHSEREERLRMLVDALSKGRLTGAIDDLLGDNNNQRST